MGTTTKTQQSNTYDPTSMGTFQTMQGPGTGQGGGFYSGAQGQPGGQQSFSGQQPGGQPHFGGVAGGRGFGNPGQMGFGQPGMPQQGGGGLGNVTANYINNPFSNPFFSTQQQMGTNQAHNMNQSNMSGLLGNMTATGMLGGAQNPAAMEMLQNQARAGTGLQSNLGFLSPVQNALGMQQGAMNLAANYHPLQTGGTTTQSTGGLGTWLPQVAGMGLGALTGGMTGGLGSLFGGLGGLFGHGMSPTGAAGVGGQWASGASPQMNQLIGGMPQMAGVGGMGGGFLGSSMGGYGGGFGGNFGSPGGYGGIGALPMGTPPPPMQG